MDLASTERESSRTPERHAPISRRHFLLAGGMAVGAAVTGAAAQDLVDSEVHGGEVLRRGDRRRFPRVKVERDRIIRTIAGLRPFRPSGFNVATETVGGKWVVHNYGHGGGGISLSWGTSQLAVDEVTASGTSACAVLGCGALGLSTARLLQDAGCGVTIYTASVPPDTTSNVAGAMWFPVTVYDPNDPVTQTPAFRERFDWACRVSNLRFQNLIGETYGVRWLQTYLLFPEKPPSIDFPGGRDLYPAYREEGRGVLHSRYAVSFYTMRIETPRYLDALLRDFRCGDGKVVVRRFEALNQVAELPEPVIVNCTGLGSGQLFGDDQIRPIKGQLAVLLPQPEVDYAYVNLDPKNFLYMFPRSDGIVLGGTEEDGESSLSPDPAQITRILKGHRRIQRR